MNQNKLVTQKQGESVPGEDQPVRRNSSLALERLRSIADQLEREGLRHLPTERELAEALGVGRRAVRSEEHTSELQSLMLNSYAVFCLKKKKKKNLQRGITHNKVQTHPYNNDINTQYSI